MKEPLQSQITVVGLELLSRVVLAASAALVALLPLAASAQSAEPEVQVRRVSANEHSPVAEDEPSVMGADEFYLLRGKVPFVDEVAVIRISFKGKWHKSADYLAREKAASLGANGLVLVESVGREDLPGAIRSYRAFRLSDSFGRAVYMKPAEEGPRAKPTEAAASPAEAPKPVDVAAASPPAPRREHRHFEWVWAHDASVLSHRLGFDAASASRGEREQLKLYVRENFPAAGYGKLAKALAASQKVVLDFVKGKVE